MNNSKNLLDEALIAKFVVGEATPEEAILVNDWIAESEENKIYFDQIESAWMLGIGHAKFDQKELVWESLKHAMSTNETRPKTLLFTPYRIAAGILLLVSVSATLYFFNTPVLSTKEIAWEMRQTRNEVADISLPDGSSVAVNRNSTLKWQKDLNGSNREILLEGEALFNVTHNPQKPFIVTVDEVKIKVLGTSFNILNNKEKNEIETAVMRGKVLMYTSQKQIIIDAGMMGIYRRQTNELVLIKMKDENGIAYATRSLTFSASTLKEVSEQLGKAYGVQFVFENEKIQECRLTTEYQNKSLQFIMDVISESLTISYRIKGNTVFLSGDGCL
jgi:transmembrane sensor